MNDKKVNTPGGVLKFGDIMYVLFRHKWKITLICLLGIAGACAMPFLMPPNYVSEAKLLVRYVLDTQTPIQEGPRDSRVKTPDDRGDGIMGSEIELLTSTDLALQVARELTEKDVFGKSTSSNTNYDQTAVMISQGLAVDVVKHSSVIHVTFTHKKGKVAQTVLAALVSAYVKKSADVHTEGGEVDNTLKNQSAKLRTDLQVAEEDLMRVKTNANIVSVEDAKKTYTEQLAKVQGQLFDASAELRGSLAWLEALGMGTNVSGTNLTSLANESTVPPPKVAEYRRLCDRLTALDKEMDDKLKVFSSDSKFVKAVQDRVDAVEQQKQVMEDQFPDLLTLKPGETRTGTGANATRRLEVAEERKKATSLQAKVDALTHQAEEIRKQMKDLSDAELKIADLQRNRDVAEARYKRLDEANQRYELAQKLGNGSVSGIATIQEASPAAPAASKLIKIMAMIIVGSFGLAFGSAFLLEFYVDQSMRRSADVKTALGLPLFMSIPRLNFNGKSQALADGRNRLLAQHAEGGAAPGGNGHSHSETNGNGQNAELAPWDPRHALRPFQDALRDRLITYFEMNNMTHKPKLVAVTSCASGSGVTTVAAGLAAALSETGDGNVLLVDMNQQGTAQQFFKGELACGLEDALITDKRDSAQVQENLYVVAEAPEGDQATRPIPMPRRFKHLVPRLRASDYDYIIFDMPAVSQTSVTPRLARFVDMVLMVVESEKTDRELVKQASALLEEVHANVGIVLNKGRTYLPKRLETELT